MDNTDSAPWLMGPALSGIRALELKPGLGSGWCVRLGMDRSWLGYDRDWIRAAAVWDWAGAAEVGVGIGSGRSSFGIESVQAGAGIGSGRPES